MKLRYVAADGTETEVQASLVEIEDDTGYLLVTDSGTWQHGGYFAGEDRS